MKNLPADALRKSFLIKLETLKCLKIKHSEALKRIQNKYKISRLCPK